ncbi:hypothetical protein XELAEV_18012805mg [Xenopus laevis]|uniref:Ubiquitin-conjugating enzyme E2 G1 n=1 Tax=Xenopus laevis TaxID=8355 RepID=A0A974DQJ9_XENLA|nr:hypothetical protein XELAEV_18012805mg [Xenopus laevis]
MQEAFLTRRLWKISCSDGRATPMMLPAALTVRSRLFRSAELALLYQMEMQLVRTLSMIVDSYDFSDRVWRVPTFFVRRRSVIWLIGQVGKFLSPADISACIADQLNKNPVEGFSAGLIDDNDLYRWEVLIIGPPDTLYEGGVFKAHLTFPRDYPLRPPKMKFITEIWHPNVDKSGDVCISILHEPGEDKYGYEKPEERWLPIHTVETIMISVISMLADPNGDSPANVDAAKEWREDRNGEFKRKVARCVRKSQETAFE